MRGTIFIVWAHYLYCGPTHNYIR